MNSQKTDTQETRVGPGGCNRTLPGRRRKSDVTVPSNILPICFGINYLVWLKWGCIRLLNFRITAKYAFLSNWFRLVLSTLIVFHPLWGYSGSWNLFPLLFYHNGQLLVAEAWTNPCPWSTLEKCHTFITFLEVPLFAHFGEPFWLNFPYPISSPRVGKGAWGKKIWFIFQLCTFWAKMVPQWFSNSGRTNGIQCCQMSCSTNSLQSSTFFGPAFQAK